VVHACMVDRRGGMCALTYLHDLHEALPCVGEPLRTMRPARKAMSPIAASRSDAFQVELELWEREREQPV